MKRPIPRRGPAAPAPRTDAAVIMPAPEAGEWELFRPPAEASRNGGTRQVFASLDALAANLQEAEPVILALPLDMGLVQRLSLPPVDSGELREMANIQLEKVLPYPVESVGMALEEIARSETEVVVAVETVPQDRLLALCQPLIERGCYPVRTIFYARAVASAAPAAENSALLYRSGGHCVLGLCENGRLSFAQSVGGQTDDELAAELPAVLLGAELEGVPTHFSVLRLDQRLADARDVLSVALGIPVETFDVAAAAATVSEAGAAMREGDLSPPGWRAERVRGEKMARLRRRIVLGVAIYLGALLLAFVALGIMRLRVGWQHARLTKLHPASEYSQAADARWQTLAPAVDPSRYVVETMFQVYQCLPPDNTVLLTAYDQSPTSLQIQGEAPSPAAADDFTVKLKAVPDLRPYHFEADPLSILPNGHARFHLTGSLPGGSRTAR